MAGAIVRLDRQGPVVVGDGALEIALGLVGVAARFIEVSPRGIEPDRVIVVRDGMVVVLCSA
jgi:hypothetical protein